MTEYCQLLPLDQIRPGMFLAEAIRDRFGNVMLPEGLELSEQNLDSLKQRGIATAMVRIDRPPMTEVELAAQTKAVQDRLNQLFTQSEDAPLNRQLKDLILRYRTRPTQ